MPASTYFWRSPSTSGLDLGGGVRHAEWACDPGDQLLTGGHRLAFNVHGIVVLGSWSSEYDSWLVRWVNPANPDQPSEMLIYIKCADTAAPAHG